MKHRRTLALFATIAACAFAPSTASAWAPEETATVHPGVQTVTNGGQCTANFIFQNGSEVYIGQSAHCASTGAATDTNGCEADSLPLGTDVEIAGASRPGKLAYSSWLAMKANGESDTNTCEYNDFALVRIDPVDVPKVNPSVPGFGGPTGLAATVPNLSDVFSYGNSSLRAGLTLLSPKQGKVVQTSGGGWTHDVYTVTPGIPGDSGSGFIDRSGRAFGTLSTVAVAPLPASNGVSNLSQELGYARANGFSGLTLVNGTKAFTPNVVGAILGVAGR